MTLDQSIHLHNHHERRSGNLLKTYMLGSDTRLFSQHHAFPNQLNGTINERGADELECRGLEHVVRPGRTQEHQCRPFSTLPPRSMTFFPMAGTNKKATSLLDLRSPDIAITSCAASAAGGAPGHEKSVENERRLVPRKKEGMDRRKKSTDRRRAQ